MPVYKLLLWILIALLFTVFIITRKPLIAMGECYVAAETELSSTAVQDAAANHDLETVCELGKQNIRQINQCLSDIEAESAITATLVTLYTSLKPDIDIRRQIEMHNQWCMQYPETIVD